MHTNWHPQSFCNRFQKAMVTISDFAKNGGGGDCMFLAFLFGFCWKPTTSVLWKLLIEHEEDWKPPHCTTATQGLCCPNGWKHIQQLLITSMAALSQCTDWNLEGALLNPFATNWRLLRGFSLHTDRHNPGVTLSKYSRSRTSSEGLLSTGGHQDWDSAHWRTTSDAPFLWFQRPFPKVPVSVTYYFCLAMFVAFNWEWQRNVITQKALPGGWGGNCPLHICRPFPMNGLSLGFPLSSVTAAACIPSTLQNWLLP